MEQITKSIPLYFIRIMSDFVPLPGIWDLCGPRNLADYITS